jgi:hypothetical protein
MNNLITNSYKQAMQTANLGLPVADSVKFRQNPVVKGVDVVGGNFALGMPISKAVTNIATGEGIKQTMAKTPEQLAYEVAIASIGGKQHSPAAYKRLIKSSGGEFVGIQKGLSAEKGYKPTPDLVLFNSPSKSTLALPKEQITKNNVMSRIKAFEKQREIRQANMFSEQKIVDPNIITSTKYTGVKPGYSWDKNIGYVRIVDNKLNKKGR